jgi:hypothetical protein
MPLPAFAPITGFRKNNARKPSGNEDRHSVRPRIMPNLRLNSSPLLEGDLNPPFRVLFSAVFHGVSLGNFHQGRNPWKVAEAKLWSFLVISRTFLVCVLIIFGLSGLRRICQAEVRRLKASNTPATVKFYLSRYRDAGRQIETLTTWSCAPERCKCAGSIQGSLRR